MQALTFWNNGSYMPGKFYLRLKLLVELAWRSGSIMDCHAMVQGSIPSGNGVFTELQVLRKGQKMGCHL